MFTRLQRLSLGIHPVKPPGLGLGGSQLSPRPGLGGSEPAKVPRATWTWGVMVRRSIGRSEDRPISPMVKHNVTRTRSDVHISNPQAFQMFIQTLTPPNSSCLISVRAQGKDGRPRSGRRPRSGWRDSPVSGDASADALLLGSLLLWTRWL